MIDERRLSTALHDLADRDETGPPPVQRLLDRGHHTRSRRTAVAAATATAGALAVTALVIAPRTSRLPAAPVPLSVAGQTTQNTTFRFSLTVAVDDRRLTITTGAYDPTSRKGSFKNDTHEALRVGPDCFYRNFFTLKVSPSDPGILPSGVAPSGDWQRAWTCGEFDMDALGSPLNPGTLLDRLSALGSVSYAGRKGGVDLYRFSYTRRIQVPGPGGDTVTDEYTGTVEIDARTKLISRVSYDMVSKISRPDTLRGSDRVRRDLVFSDYGLPVQASTPASPFPPNPTSSPNYTGR
jgi:hypothetical protein